jgi:hypothetical protein
MLVLPGPLGWIMLSILSSTKKFLVGTSWSIWYFDTTLSLLVVGNASSLGELILFLQAVKIGADISFSTDSKVADMVAELQRVCHM